jgi:hypothetical protein
MAIKKFLFMNETEGFVQPQGSADTLFGLQLNTLQVVLESGQTVAVDAGSGKITNVAAPVADTDAARKIDITSAQSSLQSALDAEIARATAAEGVLTSNLATEVAARIAGDGTLTTNLANEVSRATAAEGVLSTNLANEISRATGAEGVLSAGLASEISRAQGAESTIAGNLASEISRAQAAEGVLTTNLANEISRATAAEGVLTTNLGNEISRAQGAESTLGANLATEVAARISGDGTLTTNLANEISRATAAEGVIATNLGNEISRAQGAESAISTSLANEISRATAAEGVIATNLGNEISRATAAEGVLTSNLATEVQARIDGDAATLQSAQSYAMSLQAGFIVKAPVKAIAVENLTLSGQQSVDGVALVAGDRVLAAGQSAGADNGIYVVASGAWSRSDDADSSAEVKDGMSVYVEQGTAYHDSTWVLITNNAITLGTTALTFERFSGLGQISSGAGLVQVGQNTLAVGAGHGIQVDADSVTVKLDGSTLSKSVDGVKVLGVPSGFTINGQATVATAAELNTLANGSNASSLHYHGSVMHTQSADGAIPAGTFVYASAAGVVSIGSPTESSTARVLGVVVNNPTQAGHQAVVVTHGYVVTNNVGGAVGAPRYLGPSGTSVAYSALNPGDRVIRLGYALSGNALALNIQDMGVKSA